MKQNEQADAVFEDKLPKNVRQIGKVDQFVKIYIEDYAMTYLKRLLVDEDKHRAAILLGKKRIHNEITYLFVNSIMEIPEEVYTDKQFIFTEEIWSGIYDDINKYFNSKEDEVQILGWSSICSVNTEKLSDVFEQAHTKNFSENYTMLFLMNVTEGEEHFHIYENGKFKYIDGYYIYFEKNDAMVRYVSSNQKTPCVETEQVVKGRSESYRTVLQHRKDEVSQKKTISFLYLASTFLVMIVVVLGITMMNNYEKMKNMQDVLDALSKSVVNGEGKENQEKADSDNKNPADNHGETVMAMAQPGNDAPQTTTPQTTTPQTTAAPTAQPAEQAKPQNNAVSKGPKQYQVLPGDTLVSISKKIYNTPDMVDEICSYNNIQDSNQITAGQVIVLP